MAVRRLYEKCQCRAESRGFDGFQLKKERMNHGCKASEEANAKAYGARRQPGSGCLQNPGLKDDLRRRGVLRVEQKNPRSRKFTIRAVDLSSLFRRAQAAGELPIYIIMSPDLRWSDLAIIEYGELLSKDQELGIDFVESDLEVFNKSHTFYLDEIEDLLGSESRPAYMRLVTNDGETVYAMLFKSDVENYWGLLC